MITAMRLRELLDYDPDTGDLIWKEARGPIKAGSIAGHVTSHPKNPPCRAVTIAKKGYYVHRLVWLWHTGSWPIGSIKHINGQCLDNRIENLKDTKAVAKPPRALQPRWVALPSPLVYDSIAIKDYVPPDVRDDPRLERDHTINAREITCTRSMSWAVMAKRRKV
jgi:hypothetical protein